MSSEKFILFSLNDEKSKKLGEAISNPTCKKILALVAEKELSEEDISKELNIPMNTIEYNLKKLLHSGLIEKSKVFFWSKKGKKISIYKIANKLIVISPKNSSNVYSKLKGIFPVAIASGILTFLIYFYSQFKIYSQDNLFKIINAFNSDNVMNAPTVSESFKQTMNSGAGNWIWFLFGWLSFVVIFLIWNWNKK